MISKKIPSSQKNYKLFFSYIDDYRLESFNIVLPRKRRYVKSYDGGTTWMYFMNEDEELLKKIKWYLE